jgi:penicillin-binding protein 1A
LRKQYPPKSYRVKPNHDLEATQVVVRRRKPRRPLARVFRLVFAAICGCVVLGIGASAGYAAAMLKDLPPVSADKFSNLSAATTVYDRNGSIIGRFSKDGDRQPITDIRQVSPNVVNAFIAAEDKTFYRNIGINPMAMVRAMVQNIVLHRIKSGASTITQQTVKLALFPAQERTIKRKIQEIALALELNHILTKDEIMTDYMNWVYMGRMGTQNVYGVKAASEILFHKDPKVLNIPEAAFLASIPNNPSWFSPYQWYGHTLDRQRRILKEMRENGMITDAQYREALHFNIRRDLQKPPSSSTGRYPYILIDNVEPIVANLLVQAGLYDTVQQAKDALPTAGYNIYTTIDLDKQNIVDSVLYNQSLYGNTDLPVPKARDGRKDKYQAGVTLIDNQTGGILAIGGGRGYQQDNYDHSDVARQTGSSIKPLVDYGPAIDLHRITAASGLFDVPLELKDYNPQNDDSRWHGLVNVRQALVESMNVPAVKVLQLITPEIGVSYLEKMGITTRSRTVLSGTPTLDQSDKHQLSTAIGGFFHGLTVQQLTSAYTTFPNQGMWRQSFLVAKITDRNGHVLYQVHPQVKKVFSQQTAYIMNDMLRDVVRRGTAYAVGSHFPGLYICGKTGTTDNLTDGWFVGYTQKYTMGIWMGYNHHQPIPGSIYGPTYNLKFTIWNRIMDPIIRQTHSSAPYPEPAGIVAVSVCRKSGLRPTELCKAEKDTYTELFIQGTEPLTTCKAHVQVNYVTLNGRTYLATTNTPEDEVKTGIFLLPPSPVPADTSPRPDDEHKYVPTQPDPRGGEVLIGDKRLSNRSVKEDVSDPYGASAMPPLPLPQAPGEASKDTPHPDERASRRNQHTPALIPGINGWAK